MEQHMHLHEIYFKYYLNMYLQEMIAIADHDKDGKVTKDEFLDIARKIFQPP